MALTDVALVSHTPFSSLGTKQRSQALPSRPKLWKPEAGAYPYWYRSRSLQAIISLKQGNSVNEKLL